MKADKLHEVSVEVKTKGSVIAKVLSTGEIIYKTDLPKDLSGKRSS